MAHTAVLDGLDINDGTHYKLAQRPRFQQPEQRTEIQPYLQDDGGQIIEGSDYVGNPEHTVPVWIYGTSEDDLFTNIQALQQKIACRNVEFEFKWSGATNSSYADVLFMRCDDPMDSDEWEHYVESLQALMVIYMTCKPYWRGVLTSIGPLSYTSTPAVVKPGTILGDVETPCVTEIAGTTQGAVGGNLLIGARGANQIDQDLFNPIHDFSGTTAPVGPTFYGNAFQRTAIATSSGTWVNVGANTVNLNAVVMASSKVGWAVGDQGTILRTIDAWDTVTNQGSTTVSNGYDLYAVDAPTTNVIWAVGDGGQILRSTNAGGTWVQKQLGTAQKLSLRCVSFPSTIRGWIGGYPGTTQGKTIHRTTNGMSTGTVNFTHQTPPTTSHPILGLCAVDSNVVYAVGGRYAPYLGHYHSAVLKTTGGGSAWSAVTPGTTVLVNSNYFLYGISFPSTNSGWVCSPYGVIAKTTNKGASWTQQKNIGSGLYDISMHSSTVGWAVGANGKIYKSDGTNWTLQETNVSANLNGVSAFSENLCVAVGDGYTILDTTAGSTWVTEEGGWSLGSVADYKGTYRPQARVRTNSTDPDSIYVRASAGWSGGSVVTNSSVQLANTTDVQWVDLGAISIPASPLSSGTNATPMIKVEAAKSGTTKAANLDIDVGYILPADGEVSYCSTVATNAAPVSMDYSNDAVSKGRSIVDWAGTPGVKLRPGQYNNIVVAESQTATTGGNAGIRGVDVSMTYYPRYRSPIR